MAKTVKGNPELRKPVARKVAKNIIVENVDLTPIEKQNVELVERKGIGHPDSISDGLAESVSRALCKMYLEYCGEILHHNTDQNEVVGGQSAPKFGGGRMLEPIYILLVGRAITQVNGERLPYSTTAINAAKEYLKRFPNLDIENDVIVDCKIGKGSQDLIQNFDELQKKCTPDYSGNRCLLANDTSFGCSYAPLSETETVCLETERYINGAMKKKLKETGEDVKVMCARNGKDITMTIACAMVDRYIPDADHYSSVVEEMRNLVHDYAVKYTDYNIKVDINHADNPDSGNYYLTVTGLSAENGDDGSVGRGNRVNGLITPYRPMSMEASAGKNPITHVGKMYNILANWIATDVVKAGKGDILEAHVRILSQIGRPISDPQTCSVQLFLAPEARAKAAKWQNEARAIADNWLDDIGKVTEKVVNGKVTVF
ncbi:MAG: methionine adenosyltransferase [Methanomassiliicoccales archaeon]|nr:MAG: methionine adenosyltransferase [Methanomassiliicoccales archaeon]